MTDVIILSPDELFARMLANECSLCGLEARISPVADEYTSVARVAFLDLDLLRSVPATLPQTIGFFKNPDAVTAESRARCRILFRRPFPVTRLREELYRLFPERSVSAPVKTPHPSSPVTLTLDPIRMAVVAGDLAIPVSYHEFTLLGRLIAADGEVVPKQELAALFDRHQSNMTEAYICRLRRKIEKVLGVRLIESVRGVGYRYRN